ncbi:MAG: TadE/TadG family type IV pilus assembly protein [Acetobacteraceae bacterium]|nr:TadE/TadG family type IV pilus assembly protein [Acetobacteraceae bacterium]
MIRRLRRDRRGVAAVEFALVAVPMLMLILGTLEFGRWLWIMQALQATAAEGARCMAVLNPACTGKGGGYDAASTQTHVRTVAGSWGVALPTSGIVLNRPASITPSSGAIGNLSQVTVTYTFQSVVTGLIPALGGNKTVTAQAYVPNWQ